MDLQKRNGRVELNEQETGHESLAVFNFFLHLFNLFCHLCFNYQDDRDMSVRLRYRGNF